MSDIAVCFPWLHPLMESHLPEGVVFFNPGVQMNTQAPRWSPDNLPLTTSEVRAYLRNYQEFAQRFPRPTDMQAYQAIGLQDFYTDTTMDIRSQLMGGPENKEPTLEDWRRQAQLVLALALEREAQVVAIDAEKNHFEDARASFAQVLGLEDVPGGPDLSPASLAVEVEASWPWQPLLSALLRLLPEDMPIFIAKTEVLEAFLALGIVFTSCTLGQTELVCAKVDAATLKRIDVDLPDLERSVVFMAQPFNS